MTVAKKYKSRIKAAIHQTALGLFDAGLIGLRTMRRFDQSCLTPMIVSNRRGGGDLPAGPKYP